MHRPIPKRLMVLFSSYFIVCSTVSAQSNQVWANYVINIPFANSYIFDTEVSYQTLITKDNKWRSFGIAPDIERAITQNLDMMFSLGAAWTLQEENYNTFEWSPTLSARFTLTPNSRVLLRVLPRIQRRNLYYEEHKSWEHSTRSRLRLESIIPINRKTYFENDQWYGLLDAEVFWVMDQQLHERFANQARFRIGLGYRKSYAWRFEFIYTDQFTRDTIDQGLTEASNIFRIRIKHFLNASKPQKQDPDNN